MKAQTLKSKAVKVKGTNMKPMYHTTEITNRTNNNLWVVFEKSNPTSGIVYSMKFDRDEVRSAGRKVFATDISNIRSQRVSNYRKNIINA